MYNLALNVFNVYWFSYLKYVLLNAESLKMFKIYFRFFFFFYFEIYIKKRGKTWFKILFYSIGIMMINTENDGAIRFWQLNLLLKLYFIINLKSLNRWFKYQKIYRLKSKIIATIKNKNNYVKKNPIVKK